MSNSNQIKKPPRLGVWLLKSFCSYDYLSTALWDLDELYQHHLETDGVFRARVIYYQEVFGIIFHLYFKGQNQYATNYMAMLKINLIQALRNLRSHFNYGVLCWPSV